VGGVPPAEGDVALFEGDESVVGDGDAVGIATEIAQRVFRSAEGRLGIDDPVVTEQRSEPGGEGSRFRKWREVTVERELVVEEGGLQAGDELATKDAAEHLDRQEERMAGRDPVGVVGSEAARGGHAVDVGMMLEPLVPGMEHAEEADLRAEVAGIASDLQQGCGTGLEEQVVDDALVLEREWSEFPWQGEDEVHIAGGQQLPFACLEPAETSVRLASGTVPVAARVCHGACGATLYENGCGRVDLRPDNSGATKPAHEYGPNAIEAQRIVAISAYEMSTRRRFSSVAAFFHLTGGR
jgi:hypothetical protein